MNADRGSECVSAGVLVRASPVFLHDQSDVPAGRFVFGYRIHIVNQRGHAVRLISRRWRIVDADGGLHEVEGEGVVGQQPTIEPGASFEYASFCPLATAWGTMEGSYHFTQVNAAQDEQFEVRIGRFFLVADISNLAMQGSDI